MTKKHMKTFVALALATVFASTFAFAACGDDDDDVIPTADLKQGTYRTYTSVMPSNWCELTYTDSNDTQIMNYIYSPFFEYDYEFDESLGGKYNEDGTINADAIVDGSFTVNYAAATALEDVTASVDAKWGYTDAQKSEGGYAWKITLREDLTWDDGTPIDASSFVYTMQEMLNPLFFNTRASTMYNDMSILGAKDYLFQGSVGVADNMISANYGADEYIAIEDLVVEDSTGYLKTADGYYVLISLSDGGNWGSYGLQDYYDAYADSLFANFDGYDTLKNATATTAGYIYLTKDLVNIICDMVAILHGYDDAAAYAAATGSYAYLEWEEFCYFGTEYASASWDNVGCYAASTYEIVICMGNPIQFLKDDGSLSYLAAYNFESLPLVKEDLYEQCKVAPAAGSTLWTTTYGTSLATSASWGPYKLTQFQSGKSYTLSKNDAWFGYDLDMYANQYNVTAIECEQIAETSTQWMSFLSGGLDEISLDVDHADDYRNSKYTIFSPGTGTFGIQLYSNLSVLNQNGRNNSILAISAFREAISLYIDRDDYNSTLYTAHRTCYGLLGPSYYYDVENGGVYRNTQYAKEALLRVYGFTENADGTWTDGTNTYDDYQEAYDAMDGYNPTLAKQLVEEAYQELISNPDTYNYDDSQKITIVYGTSTDNTSTRRAYNYFVELFADLTAGTSLEGKIELTFDASASSSYADYFRSGAYDMLSGTGYSGGAFDPCGFLQCYVDPDAGLMYSTWWDTNTDYVTYTLPDGDYAQAGQTYTMSVYNWYCCLNGIAETNAQTYTFNWGSGAIDEEARLQILAMLEEYVLSKYYTIITTSQYSAVVTSAKFSYISSSYNTFMGFGGVRYMIVNYTDSEWETFVSDNGGDLTTEYQKEE